MGFEDPNKLSNDVTDPLYLDDFTSYGKEAAFIS